MSQISHDAQILINRINSDLVALKRKAEQDLSQHALLAVKAHAEGNPKTTEEHLQIAQEALRVQEWVDKLFTAWFKLNNSQSTENSGSLDLEK